MSCRELDVITETFVASRVDFAFFVDVLVGAFRDYCTHICQVFHHGAQKSWGS